MKLHESERQWKNASKLNKKWKEITEIVVYECRDPEKKMSQRSQIYFHGMSKDNQSTVGPQLCLQYKHKYRHALLTHHGHMGNALG